MVLFFYDEEEEDASVVVGGCGGNIHAILPTGDAVVEFEDVSFVLVSSLVVFIVKNGLPCRDDMVEFSFMVSSTRNASTASSKSCLKCNRKISLVA